MYKNISLFLMLLICLNFSLIAKNKTETKPNNSSIKKFEGFFNFQYDEKQDKILLEVTRINFEFLYINYLSTGIGSNDIGLDRGQIGNQRIVKFIKAGNKLLLTQPNYKFRTESDNIDELKAVKEAFAQSIIWGFKIEKEDKGIYYIDVSNFFLRDAHNVIGKLDKTGQGNYQLDKSRSAFYLNGIKNFPKNSEFEVILTYKGKPKDNYIKSVTPSPENVTVRQHHSFVQLPDNKYSPRLYDPRSGFIYKSYLDYSAPITEPLKKKFIIRHRLEKKDPNAKISEPVKPIIYYLDRGTPEPVRSALLEGGRWWNQAFEAIGYKNAFRFELLPKDADPFDIRYNIVQWIHRSERGWSYGGVITDPRTGEIIKAHVTLGSLRVRQNFLIAEGLVAPYKNGDEAPEEALKMALARIKQLSAHEIGHTLGLTHNFIASSEGRSSVMDYPHPLARIVNGKIVLDDAYEDKIGAWDKIAIAYGYKNFPDGTNEQEALNQIIQNRINTGISYLSNLDAIPKGSLHPKTHLWDNGIDAIDELNRVMEIRALAINNFGEKNIPVGTPFVKLESVLTPIYFFHRYQLEATAKIIGGLDYTYAVRGDHQFITKFISSEEQYKALDALLATITPEALKLPENLLQMMPPRTHSHTNRREITLSRTGLTFDALGAAETSANMVISLILHPERVSRLLEYHSRDNKQPGLDKIITKLLGFTWKKSHQKGHEGEIQRAVDFILLQNLLNLTVNKNVSDNVKSIVFFQLEELRKWLKIKSNNETNETLKAHYIYAEAKISRFQRNPEKNTVTKALKPPTGSPIGMDSCY